MSTFCPCEYPILFEKVWNTTGLAKDIAALDRNAHFDEYGKLIRNAPRRSERGKPYFVAHGGKQSVKDSNRREEILAKALQKLNGSWARPGPGGGQVSSARLPVSSEGSAVGSGHRQGRSARGHGPKTAYGDRVEGEARGRKPWRGSNESADGGTALCRNC